MRVSEHFGLVRRQPFLDFVDVDVEDDSKLFVDPRAITLLPSEWGNACTALVSNFFDQVLTAIRENREADAIRLLSGLTEPNETHLGLSEGRSRGRAVGPGLAQGLWEAFGQSEAVHHGLIEELEDSILLVPGIGPDIISDIATNVLREPLIEYTQAVCHAYGIPLTPDVVSGRLWNPTAGQWFEKYVELPTTGIQRLLLVPKVIVRQRSEYDAGEYFHHYILTILQQEELDANSALVRMLKNGRKRVTKKALTEKYGTGKSVIVEQTIRHPEALRRYRDDHRVVSPPLGHEELASDPARDLPDFDALIGRLNDIKAGRDDSTDYEVVIEDLLYALFYPALTSPERQVRIHDGRKRIDITYQNVDRIGFFRYLSLHEACPFIFVECKNYAGDPGNPELDQLAGRFSPQRGRVGLLVCRRFEDKDLFVKRCRDTAGDNRGWILPVDDYDLINLVEERRNGSIAFPLLVDRFQQIVG